MAPAISVIMPVYNGQRYLRAAASSILAQSFADFEFLIVDDGSTDATPALLRELAARDRRVQVSRTERMGVTGSLNRLLGVARGDFVARMDADDISLPERLARQHAFLRDNRQCVAVGCQTRFIDPDGRPMTDWSWPVHHVQIVQSLYDGLTALPHPAVMMRRQAVARIGGYDPEFEFAQDFDLWLRLAQEGKLANLTEVLFWYRLHERKIGFAQVDRQTACAQRALVRAYARQGKIPPAELLVPKAQVARDGHFRIWAQMCLFGGHYHTARKHAWTSVRENPKSWLNWCVYLAASALGLGQILLPRRVLSRIWPWLVGRRAASSSIRRLPQF